MQSAELLRFAARSLAGVAVFLLALDMWAHVTLSNGSCGNYTSAHSGCPFLVVPGAHGIRRARSAPIQYVCTLEPLTRRAADFYFKGSKYKT
jgi:hypothetical protein